MKNPLLKAFHLNCSLLFLLQAVGSIFAQDIPLQGQVSLHNSQYKTGQIQYVDQAYVSADFATAANSNAQGEFSILFRGLPGGSSVGISVEKAGLEVVNQRELLDVVIPRREKLRIYLAPRGSLAKAQTELYDINLRSITRRYDRYIERLKNNQEKALAELETDMGRKIADRWEAERLLKEQLDATTNRLPKVTQELARVNLDFAAEYYRRAYEAFRRGELDSVILILEAQDLDVGNNLAAIERAKQDLSLIQQSITDNEAAIKTKLEALSLKIKVLEFTFQYQKAIQALQIQAKVLSRLKPRSQELGDLYGKLAANYWNQGAYDSCLLYRKKSLAIFSLDSQAEKEQANQYDRLAGIYIVMGEPDSAIMVHNKAAQVKRKLYPPSHSKMANSYYVKSSILMEMGKLDSAIFYQRAALKIQQQQDSLDLRAIAKGFSQLGLQFIDKNQADSSLKYQRKSLMLRKQVHPDSHPEFGSVYNDLSISFRILKQYDSALFYIRESISLNNHILAPDHPETANSLSNLGQLYADFNQYDSALFYYRKSNKIFEETLSPSNAIICKNYQDLGRSYMVLRQFDSAYVYLKKAQSIGEGIWEPNHFKRAIIYDDLGLLFSTTKSLDSAKFYYEQSLEIAVKNSDERPMELIVSYNNLSKFYGDQRKFDSGMVYMRKSVALMEKTFGRSHPRTYDMYQNFAVNFFHIGKYDSAAIYLNYIYPNRKALHGENSPAMFPIYQLWGIVLDRLGKLDSALIFSRVSLNILENIQPVDSLEMANTHNRIGLIFRKKMRYDSAYLHLRQAAIYRSAALGAQHPIVGTDYYWVGITAYQNKALDSAAHYFLKAESLWKPALPQTKANFAFLNYWRAKMYLDQEQIEAGLDSFEQAFQLAATAIPPDHRLHKQLKELGVDMYAQRVASLKAADPDSKLAQAEARLKELRALP
ncbi:MAG: tetratricopeptide repeat protein [Bacteroidota bacterium]